MADREYIVLNYTQKKTFYSREDLEDFLKDKIQPEGKDSWKVEEKIIKTLDIPVTRRPNKNLEILQKIIDTFIEKATPKNIKFDDAARFDMYQLEDRYKKYENASYSRAMMLFFGIKLGLSQETLDRIYEYSEIDNHELGLYPLISMFKFCEELTGEKADNKDISVDNFYIGDISVDNFYNGELKKKYPKTYKILRDNFGSPNDIDNYEDFRKLLFYKLTENEYLDIFKKKLKEFPLSKIKVVYNSGNYKPCNNYSLIFEHEYDYNHINVLGNGLPNIMFRDRDIYLTKWNYIGRHVSHKYTTVVDVDNKLYEYCIKNLK